MLQRAASNAYSWWWASHIRTKQSKWLEQNLQDMEEKVASTLKLIQEDGDSFAKRAEMYYRKRPELIFFVEESYRAYRALAERYDHLSTELQNANNTIASVFPDRVPYSMDDDDDDVTPRSGRKLPMKVSRTNGGPQVPSAPIKDLKRLVTSAATKKKSQPKKLSYKTVYTKDPPKSGFEKTEALGEIDKLQKQILTLQTEKEFVKSSYESGLAKYWEIEKKITEQQEKISGLQDVFGEGMVIEDDEARTLMAATALKSCQEALAQLQEKHERSAEEANAEKSRIKKTLEKFESLKLEFLHTGPEEKVVKTSNEEVISGDDAHVKELGTLREKIKERFEVGPNASLTVSELAEKMDEIVGKVIDLETSVSSQSALIHRLKSETDDLQGQIRNLEDDKEKLIHGKNSLSDKLREMEKRLNELQDLNRSIEEQNNKLQIRFTEASSNLDHLSDKLREVKPDEEIDVKSASHIEDKSEKEIRKTVIIPNNDLNEPQMLKPDEIEASCPAQKEQESPSHVKSVNEVPKQEQEKLHIENDLDVKSQNFSNSNGNQDLCQAQAIRKSDNEVSSPTLGSLLNIDPEQEEKQKREAEEPDWKQLYMNGMEEREKNLLIEYTAVLRSYKEMKKKLSEADTKTRDNDFDTTVQIRELKSAIAMKDEEIRLLRQKLKHMHASFGNSLNFRVSDKQQNAEIDDVSEKPTSTPETLATDKEVDVRYVVMEQHENTSASESKFRGHIDELLEENLDFWLRFSSSFSQIQKFDTEVQDLEDDLAKIEERQKKFDGSSSASAKYSLKSDARPLYKHLKDIHSELSVWLEKSMLLKGELKSRFTSLCEIQEEITKALKESAEDDEFKFTTFQAAKFQGEVLNMKQENNKVADELQAGLDHIMTLQLEVEKTLARMNEELKVSGSKVCSNSVLPHSESRSRISLRSFIFGVKPKKQKTSFFACVHPTLQKRYYGFRFKKS